MNRKTGFTASLLLVFLMLFSFSNAQPICDASFTINQTGSLIEVTGNSFDPGAIYTIDWGDTINPVNNFWGYDSMYYPVSGLYIICVTETDTLNGCSDTYCDSVLISAGCTCSGDNLTYIDNGGGNFTFSYNPGSISGATFTGGYLWNIEGSMVSQPASFSHTFGSYGTHLVNVTSGTSTGGCSGCDDYVYINYPAPVTCDAEFSTSFSGAGTIDFNSSASIGNIYDFHYDFGDGNAVYTSDTNYAHTYASSGFYNVCLTLMTWDSCFSTQCDSVFVPTGSGVSCDASFSIANFGNGFVSTNNTSMGGTSADWYWGDGSSASGWNTSHTYTSTGTYSICLYLNDSLGFCDSICQNLYVYVPPATGCSPSFSLSSSGNDVTLYNNTTGDIGYIEVYWDMWGFGAMDSLMPWDSVATYTYPTSGTYSVCLYVYDSSYNFCDSICQGVTVSGGSPPCSASFTTNNLGNGSVTTNNTSTGGYSADWYWGDGGSSSGWSGTHTYAASGTYSVCLYVNDSLGFCDSICQNVSVTVSPPPVGCNLDIVMYQSGNTVTVVDSGLSTYSAGDVYWGNGAYDTLNPGWFSYTYSTPGIYEVCAVAYDSNWAVCDSVCQSFIISSPAVCSASFTTNNLGNGSVTTNNTSTGGYSADWYWGDGGSSNGWTGAHTYAASGTYSICMWLNDSLGFCDSICQSVNVTVSPPVVGCNLDIVMYQSGNTVTVVDSGLSSYLGGDIYWGNGAYDTLTAGWHSYTYTTSGIYQVCAVAYDSMGYGCDTVCQSFIISSPAVCSASFTTNNLGNGSVTTNNTSTGGYSADWYWGDGGSSSGWTGAHTYAASGTYSICMWLNDSLGFCDSICQNVTVNVSPPSSCTVGISMSQSGNTVTVVDNGLSTYTWGDITWGNGVWDTLNPGSQSYTYTMSGTYQVCVAAYDSMGSPCDSVCQNFIISIANPGGCTASFTTSNLGNGNVTTNNTSTGGYSADWYWGDGNMSSGWSGTHTYTASGTYSVCLYVNDSLGFCDSTCQSVTVTVPPVPGCNLDIVMYQSGNTVTVVDSGLSSYLWGDIYWGNGATDTLTAGWHSYTYTTSGIYQVCAIAYDSMGYGCDTVCQSFIISIANPGGCSASFTTNNLGNGSVTTNNTSTGGYSADWYWGDGGSSSGWTGAHTYAASGTYSVCLYVNDSLGFCDSICQNVTVNVSPPSSCTVGISMSQSGNTVTVFDNGMSTYTWGDITWGNGVWDTLNPGSQSYTYTTNGTYNVCVAAYDSMGSPCDSVCQTFVISTAGSPTCNAVLSTVQMGNSGDVHYDGFGSTSSGTVSSYYWDFGDGGFSTSNSGHHTYASSGTYWVCLAIATSDGCSDTTCSAVVVNIIPVPTCYADFGSFVIGNTAIFTNGSASTANIVDYSWSFGDGNGSTDESPMHTYANPGMYLVCLNMYGMDSTTGDSCWASFCDTLEILTPASCVAGFSHSNVGPVFNFVNTSSGPYSALGWDFGNGNTSTLDNPVETFGGPGTYYVCLSLFDSAGFVCDSICQTVVVTSMAVCNADFTFNTDGNNVYFHSTSSTTDTTVNHLWTFGDGTPFPGNGTNVSHFYINPGTYEVCLSISTTDSCADSTCQMVTVTAPPVSGCHADFGVSPQPGNQVIFQDLSSVDSSDVITNWSWDYGDGGIDFGNVTNHIYANTGTYLVCLTIETLDSCTSTNCDSINVTGGLIGIDPYAELEGSVKVYPNPFSESATIDVTLVKEAMVGISIFDLNGKMVHMQEASLQSVGMYSYGWEPQGLSQGMYLVRLMVDGQTIIKKVILE